MMLELLANSLLAKIGALSALFFITSLLSLPWLVALIPEDYFLHKKRQHTQWKTTHPLARFLVIFAKNFLGYILLFGGILMLFLPGQGILTLVMGLLLIDYPGKFELEKKIAKTPRVFKGLNWLRAKANKPPLK
jgi:archaellum biogenesis protein FlaJ (TadC family)